MKQYCYTNVIFKIIKVGVVLRACNPSTEKAEFQGQPGLRKILSLKQNNTTENTDFSENIGQIFY
jgi:hypothetical protein